MEFERWLIVKLILEKSLQVWKLGCIALFGPLKQMLSYLKYFVDLHSCRTCHQEQFLFYEYGLI
jgi:hypothetical protein